MSSPRRRVVVTGLGAVTPLGLTVRETWSAALESKNGVGPITLFDPTDCPVQFAAEVRGFDLGRAFPAISPRPDAPPVTQASHPKDGRRLGRFIQFALVAGLEAYVDSGLDAHRKTLPAEQIGLNIGVGMGGLPEIESVHDDLIAKGYRRMTPFFIPQVIANMASGQLSILLNAKGSNQCSVSACASSAHAIGESARLIERGDATVMIAGGAEAVICKLGIGGFAAMKAMSTRNDSPHSASRPFDVARDGFVMGEGAAVLILEEYEHAKNRGAKIYAELAGYGVSGDAYHMTSPAPEHEGGHRAMSQALEEARLKKLIPNSIQYVNAHGTSTPAGDVEEAVAVAHLFPKTGPRPFVSSTKSMTGHLLGGAGAIEAIFSILALRDQMVPPTLNLENLDPACAALGLDFVPHQARKAELHATLSNSFGFGGTNASLIFSKVGA